MAMKKILMMVLIALTAVAQASDGTPKVTPKVQLAGDQTATFWLSAHGIEPPFEVHVSGDGIEQTRTPYLVPAVEGSEGDGVVVDMAIDWQATPGPRDVWLEDASGLRVIRQAFMLLSPRSPVDTYAQAIRVDAVSRASPSYARPGEQINLWIVGQGFEPGSQVSFDKPGVGPATVNNQPLPTEVFLRSQGVNGEYDGIQYYMQIDGPDVVMPGPVNVTVTNLDNSATTGFGLFEILPVGQTAPPVDMNKPVDAITGASPRAVFLGRNVSLWVWGEGFAPGAQIEFLSPQTGGAYQGIQSYTQAEVVEHSTSHPGYAGIRAFLLVDAMAPQGAVDVRVTNPNGTSQTAPGLFSLVAATEGAVGSNGQYTPSEGGCPPAGTPIQEITSVSPGQVVQGEGFELVITGYGFACGAAVSISGGGMVEVSPLALVPGNDVTPSVLSWRLKALDTARTGARTISVINPDNASKVQEGAFAVTPSAQLTASPGCTHGQRSTAFPTLSLILAVALWCVVRRRESSDSVSC
jgi:hypothetical protein